ncbi:MAG: indole-3-glycerol phosphate synthase TrpC [Rickettsiales bacterium]
MKNILNEICTYKKEVIRADKKLLTLEKLKIATSLINSKSNFYSNITNNLQKNKPAIIAEIKQKSPSQGILKETIAIDKIAAAYKDGGACCISVLTDEKYFQGANKYIHIARKNSNLPILRKDFIIDEYQIYQAKHIGADAILLIMSCLSKAQAKEYEALANSLGLDVLVESYNEEELINALELKTKLIGINNRNLKNLTTSLDNIKNLKKHLPEDKILICESGINSFSDYQTLRSWGLNCFLIGGYLMKQNNISIALKELMNN